MVSQRELGNCLDSLSSAVKLDENNYEWMIDQIKGYWLKKKEKSKLVTMQ